MAYGRFLAANAVGGIIWSGLHAFGFNYLGSKLAAAIMMQVGMICGYLTTWPMNAWPGGSWSRPPAP